MDRVSSSEMAKIDRYTIEEIGISEKKLMEVAGIRIAELVRDRFEPQKVRVFAGKGNNGGDGIVAARKLYEYGFEPVVSIVGELREVPKIEMNIIKNLGVDIASYKQEVSSEVVIDALFGYNIKSNPRPPYNNIINRINDLESEVVSVDVPSGLNPENGKRADPSIESDYCIYLAASKKGAEKVSGKKFVTDIGIPAEAYQSEGIKKPGGFEQKSTLEV